ncbi:hypothetical protein ACFRH4_39905 [Streptomyces mirabilis]|uniref:hypothetical protein n=1 Tax=Streptomyces mirabilis TaxID=68239 RepID=UPI00369F4616
MSAAAITLPPTSCSRKLNTSVITHLGSLARSQATTDFFNPPRSLSATVDRTTRHEILHPAAEELRSRIAAAQASLELIEGGLNCVYEDVTQCPNYRRLIAERAGHRSPAGEPVTEAVAVAVAPTS